MKCTLMTPACTHLCSFPVVQEYRGPLGEIDHEKKAPPAYVDFACILDYMLDACSCIWASQSTSQLGAITCWSGRVLQDERGKNKLPDFVEAARKMGKQQSVLKPLLPLPNVVVPSGMQNFYNRLDADRIAGLLMVSPECKAAMHKTNLDTDPAYLVGSRCWDACSPAWPFLSALFQVSNDV
eukprot:1161954-Pelagomonas_calceolata.AAC.9